MFGSVDITSANVRRSYVKLCQNFASTSVLGNAAWTTQRAGGMIAIDANEIYVLLNTGATTAELWKTLDGGTAWTKINDAPFAIEHGALSRHADGRLLIGNRNPGAAQAAWLATPYESNSWIDASGGLPGSGVAAVVWVG